jgi:cytochrome c oxidase assembly protein subunit 15
MTSNSTLPSTRVWLRRYTKLVAAATLCLIFLGGQVKSHEAGLAVPDWPETYGYNMFLYPLEFWVGNIFHEHFHRVFAASVGLLCIVLAVWMAVVERRPWARWLGAAALMMVIIQGLFGGLTVKLLLLWWVSTTHALLAQTFFLLTLFIAYAYSRERDRRVTNPAGPGSWVGARPALIVMALVYLQLLVGALMRHTESALAIPDFPTMAGGWSPFFDTSSLNWVNAWRGDRAFETGVNLGDVTLAQLWIHFAHRAGAILVSIATLYALIAAYRARAERPEIWRSAAVLAALVVFQISLGIATILTERVPVIASLHVVTGAATLGWSGLMALRAMPLHLRAGAVRDASADAAPIAAHEVRA